MSASDVHAWLQGPRHYDEGVALLRAANVDDDALFFLLSLGETSVSRAALEDALTDIRKSAIRRAKAAQATAHVVPVVTRATIQEEREQMARDPRTDGFDGVQLPEKLAAQRDRLPGLFQEMHYLRGRLELQPDDHVRLLDVRRIVAIDAQIGRIYARLDGWKATGTDPGEEPPPPLTSGVKLQRELQNIVSYISRARSGGRPASPAKIAAWEERKAELIRLIDALPG